MREQGTWPEINGAKITGNWTNPGLAVAMSRDLTVDDRQNALSINCYSYVADHIVNVQGIVPVSRLDVLYQTHSLIYEHRHSQYVRSKRLFDYIILLEL